MLLFTCTMIITILGINKYLSNSVVDRFTVIPSLYLVVLAISQSELIYDFNIVNTTTSVIWLYATVFYIFSRLAGSLRLNISYHNKNDFLNKNVMLGGVVVALLIYYIFYSFKAYDFFVSNGLEGYRVAINGYKGEDSPVFGGGFSLFVYQFIIKGLLTFLSIYTAYHYVKERSLVLIAPLTVVIMLECVVSMGRFPIYAHLFIIVATSSIYGILNFRLLVKSFLIFIVPMIALTLFRFSSFENTLDVILRNLIGYHLFGVGLLNYQLSNSSAIANEWFGPAFGGAVLYFPDKIASLIGFPLETYMFSSAYRHLGEFVSIGVDSNGIAVYANAYYTNLNEMFMDLGYVSLFLYSAILGSIYGFLAKISKINKDDFLFYSLFIFFLFVNFFGIYNSQFLLIRNVFTFLYIIMFVLLVKIRIKL